MEEHDNIDDGGPAFPCEGGPGGGLHSHPGMSLRDWFAAHVSLIDSDGDCIDVFSMSSLIGRPAPSDAVELILWYAEAEAAIRYVKADAMLARRNKETARA
jgi:hypothetical protein